MILPSRFIEVARSHSRKINRERFNPAEKYESSEFFCSAKGECHAEEAETLSGALYDFCRNEVSKAIAMEFGVTDEPTVVEHQPSIDKYAVEVIGPDYKERVDGLPAPSIKEIDEPSRLRAIVMGTVPKCTKKHLAEFYAGWFGVDGKQLPKDPEAYLEPLRVLIKLTEEDKASHELLVSNSKKLGLDTKSSFLIPMEEVTIELTPEPTPQGGDWAEFMQVDPLMEKYHWKAMETSKYASLLMAKYGHDEKKFGDHLRFLKMDILPEPDLLCLFKLLIHGPEGNALWKEAQRRGVSMVDAFDKVEKHLGYEVNMHSNSQEVIAAIGELIKK